MLLFSLLFLFNFVSSIDINVFIYDATQETVDESSEILNNCNCESTDIVTSFNDSWNNIYNKSQTETSIENINFYFLSKLIITNNDINKNINDLLSVTSNFNISSSSSITINFQCAKSLSIFTPIQWNSDDTECILTFTDSIQNATDSLLLLLIDDNITTTLNTIDIDTTIMMTDLITNFNPNQYNGTSQGILFQTLPGNDNNISNIHVIFNNMVIEGGFNNDGPLFTITQYVASLTITNAQFYEMSHSILLSENIRYVYIENITIINVTTSDDEVMQITESIDVILNNIDSEECHGYLGCISIITANSSIVDNFKCIKCRGMGSAFYGRYIRDLILTNIYIYDCIGSPDDDSLSAGLRVKEVTNFKFEHGILDRNSAEYSGVLVLNTLSSFYLNNLSFTNNTILAISFVNAGQGMITNCNFTGNLDSGSGGAIRIGECGNPNYYEIRNCIFKDNKAEKFAGAIMIQYCIVLIVDSIFIHNEADIGGGVAYLDWASQNPLQITNSIFSNNIAYSSGGAMYVFSGEYILDNIQCIDNQAKISGGCIHDANGFLDCADANLMRTRIRNSKFYGNKARQAAVGYLTSCYFSMDDSEIINNTAYIQGGGFVIDSTAIDYNNNDIDKPSSSQYELNNILFSGNYGGLSGGGMILTGGDIRISGNTIFNKNAAGSKGGAILIQGIDEWMVNTNINNVEFIGNKAENGGAILMETIQLSSSQESDDNNNDNNGANLILNECDLDSNTATFGGAVYIANGNVETNDCLLTNNYADNGGALYFENGIISDYNSIFDDNTASISGGAVYINNNDILFDETLLTSNRAYLYGGAIYFADNSDNSLNGECLLTSEQSKNVTISNNTALLSGGGYFFEINDILRSEYNDFDCNTISSVCSWCIDCKTILNEAEGFGDNLATQAYKMNVKWNINIGDKLNRIKSIRVDVSISDFQCQLVSKFDESDVTLTAFVSSEDNNKYPLILDGSSLETFNNGRASLLFQVIPENEKAPFIENNIIFNITITVISSLQEIGNNNNNNNAASTALFIESINVYYENKLYSLPTSVIVLGTMLGIISLITVLITIYFTKYYGREKIITGANVYFLFIILTGIGFASISMIFIPLTPFQIDCRILIWFIHFAFVLTVCPLAGKTWRIWLFFYYYQGPENKRKEFKWTTLRLANVFVLLPMFIVIIYLIIWSTAPNWDYLYSYTADNEISVIKSCPFHSYFYTISYIVVSISILILVRLAIGTRKVPRNFNESFWMGACIYTICILIIFMIPISLVNTINIQTRTIFSIIASFVVIQSMLLFLFWTKFFKIKGWFTSNKFNFMKDTYKPSDRTATNGWDIKNNPSSKSRSYSPNNTTNAKNKILKNMRNKNKNNTTNSLNYNTKKEKDIIPSTTNTTI